MGNINLPKKEELHPDLYYYKCWWNNKPAVNHFLLPDLCLVDPNKETELNFEVNQKYLEMKRRHEMWLKEKDYESIFLFMSDPHKIPFFSKHYRRIFKDVGEEEYYCHLADILTKVHVHHYTKRSYSKLLYWGSDPLKMMNDDEKKLYGTLPEHFMIYRGISYFRRINEPNFQRFVGNSWTIDKEKAIWFSTESILKTGKYNYLLSTEISKSQALSYFTGRKEDEIFVDFEKLDFSKIKFIELK